MGKKWQQSNMGKQGTETSWAHYCKEHEIWWMYPQTVQQSVKKALCTCQNM